MTKDDIVCAARAALGTPFKHQGRKSGVGLDCAGLLVHVGKSLGVELVDQSGYGRIPSGGRLEQAIADNVEAGLIMRVGIRNIVAGDLVLMKFESDRAPRHLGIVGNDNTIIHAWATVRKVCEHRIDDEWQRRIIGAWRFSGVES